jgi:hypothetical protein
MYGLVNRAVEQMVRERFGAERWHAIQARAGLEDEGFLALRTYPDEVTYRLVAAASEELGVPAPAVLEAFGEYWVAATAQASYGDLMRLSGRTLPEFLQNLDQMHSRLALTFEHMQPPSFTCSEVTPTSLVLHYQSSRAGLLPFVVGLVKGLGEYFHTPARVEVVATREDGAPCDSLRVTMEA